MKRLVVLVAAAASACTPPDVRPQLAPRTADTLGLSAPAAPVIDARWWQAYRDPQLDRLVDLAIDGSPTLEAALARVRQAEAVLSTRRAENGPGVTLDVEPQVARLSGRYTIPPPYAGTVRFVGTATANLSWNLDLFGRQKAAIEGARASVRAAGLDVAAARLMLAASVVQAYLDLARAERQAAVARQAIATRQGSLRLVDVRIRNQLASKLDREAAATLLAQAQAALVRAEGARALAADALAALAGQGADMSRTLGPTSLKLEAALPIPDAVPIDLLGRRADILAAEARIGAAAAGRQVARRAYYPNINLLALAGLQAIGIGNLVDPAAITVGGGGALRLPLFDSGRLRADLVGAAAAEDVAIADYNGRVVTAVRDTADALAIIARVDAERKRQREVVRGFAETGRLNNIRVSSGLSSRLDLVDNDVRLLDAELADANLSIDAAAARVRLVLALGGGFDPSRDRF